MFFLDCFRPCLSITCWHLPSDGVRFALMSLRKIQQAELFLHCWHWGLQRKPFSAGISFDIPQRHHARDRQPFFFATTSIPNLCIHFPAVSTWKTSLKCLVREIFIYPFTKLRYCQVWLLLHIGILPNESHSLPGEYFFLTHSMPDCWYLPCLLCGISQTCLTCPSSWQQTLHPLCLLGQTAFYQPAAREAHGRLVLRLLCVFHVCIYVRPHLWVVYHSYDFEMDTEKQRLRT